MAGIILAGGKGERLGGARKALQPLGGKTLLDWVLLKLQPLFTDLILVTNSPELYPAFPGRVVTDIHPHRGPLSGIESGLMATSDPVSFITGCDMPLLNPKLIESMLPLASRYDIVIPRLGRLIEPLHAFYSRRALGVIQAQLTQGNYKLSALLHAPLSVCYLNEEYLRSLDPGLESFQNINTPADLARARALLKGDATRSGAYSYS